MSGDTDHDLVLAAFRREIMAADAVEADLNLAYQLQLQEAMSASLAAHPSSSAAAAVGGDGVVQEDDFISQTRFQAMELDRVEQEEADRAMCEAEMRRVALDLKRAAHDAAFAREILNIPDDEWENTGNWFARPMDAPGAGAGAGAGADASPSTVEPFKLYFKGTVSAEASIAAVAVAVCDPSGLPVLQIGKPVVAAEEAMGMNRTAVEIKALIEGLNAVVLLDIKKVDIIFDFRVIHHYATGQWTPNKRKIVNLMDQVYLLQRKLESSRMLLKPSCELEFVYKIAKDVIDCQLSKPVVYNVKKSTSVTCSICLETIDVSQMFVVDECAHSYCFSCMKQHVEVQLLHGVMPSCPHDKCGVKLNVDRAKKYLAPKSVVILTQRVQEASIPEADRLYCPYPKCSALMSKREMTLKHQGESSSQRRPSKVYGVCIKCHGPLCLLCKDRWHDNISCYENKRRNCLPEELKLENLAKQKFWRRCVKCNHMIELAEGCFHMTCRCGYEFCYTCGAQWKNKKATCGCPLWDENNILYDDGEESDDYDDGLI